MTKGERIIELGGKTIALGMLYAYEENPRSYDYCNDYIDAKQIKKQRVIHPVKAI